MARVAQRSIVDYPASKPRPKRSRDELKFRLLRFEKSSRSHMIGQFPTLSFIKIYFEKTTSKTEHQNAVFIKPEELQGEHLRYVDFEIHAGF